MGTDELLGVLNSEIWPLLDGSAKSEGEQALGYNSATGAPC
jgi:hypothetical protein